MGQQKAGKQDRELPDLGVSLGPQIYHLRRVEGQHTVIENLPIVQNELDIGDQVLQDFGVDLGAAEVGERRVRVFLVPLFLRVVVLGFGDQERGVLARGRQQSGGRSLGILVKATFPGNFTDPRMSISWFLKRV